MKIVVTGSLGNISRPLTEELVQRGHQVTVISSRPERASEIEALGATAAIGSVDDVQFLTNTFTGADSVYCMEPPPANLFDQNFDVIAAVDQMATNYAQAIEQAGVKHVVHLSSIGAHTNKGNGILIFHYNAEAILNQLPADVSITFMRPVGFYNNLFMFIGSIKTQGVMASNYGGDDKVVLVSPIDIASAVAEELTAPAAGRKVRYVASEETTCNEVAATLGAAIGKPDLQWMTITDEQQLQGLLAAGMNTAFAKGYVAMNASTHTGTMYEDYYRNHPELGKVKIKDFALQFAAAYNK